MSASLPEVVRIADLADRRVALWGWGHEGKAAHAALHALAQRPEWREDAVVARYAREIAPQLDAAALDLAPWLAPSDEHQVPQRLRGALRALA